eukprot:5921934-Prymnesium_polylepis.1
MEPALSPGQQNRRDIGRSAYASVAPTSASLGVQGVRGRAQGDTTTTASEFDRGGCLSYGALHACPDLNVCIYAAQQHAHAHATCTCQSYS